MEAQSKKANANLQHENRAMPKKELTIKKLQQSRAVADRISSKFASANIARSLSMSVLTSKHSNKIKLTAYTRGATKFTACTRGAKSSSSSFPIGNSSSDVASIYPDGSFCCFVALDHCGDEKEHSFGHLKSAVNDALKLKEHLVEDRDFSCIDELYNEQATAQNIRKLFSQVKSTLKGKPKSRFIFFLACHTLQVQEEQEAWLGLFGFDAASLEATSLEVRELRTFAYRVDSIHQLFLLDSCHSGTLLHRVRSVRLAAASSFETSMACSPAVLGMAASSSNQQAAENQAGGLFTTNFLKALKLKDENKKEKKNAEWKTAHEIFADLARGVSRDAYELYGHTQTPAFGVLFSETKLGVKCEGSVLFRV